MSNISQNIQLGGTAFFSTNNNFFFTPDTPIPNQVARFRREGRAEQLSDGTFEFIPARDRRSQAKLIRKLAHGRASETKDGAIQLTIKIYKTEDINISRTILEEAIQGADAIREYQLKH